MPQSNWTLHYNNSQMSHTIPTWIDSAMDFDMGDLCIWHLRAATTWQPLLLTLRSTSASDTHRQRLTATSQRGLEKT
jgi:hypothetical protein